jgi:hypothetical protein
MFGGVFLFVLFCVLGFALYFLPSFIGWNKRSSGAIIALNILLGWTFIGWVVALVWSLTADQPMVVVMQTAPQQVLPAAPMLCSACGHYSPAASCFCQTCGRSLAETLLHR